MLTGAAWGFLFCKGHSLRKAQEGEKKSKEGVQVSQKFYRKASSEGLTGCWKQLTQLAHGGGDGGQWLLSL